MQQEDFWGQRKSLVGDAWIIKCVLDGKLFWMTSPIKDGQPCIPNGKPCIPNGHPCISNGQPCIPNGKPRFPDGQP